MAHLIARPDPTPKEPYDMTPAERRVVAAAEAEADYVERVKAMMRWADVDVYREELVRAVTALRDERRIADGLGASVVSDAPLVTWGSHRLLGETT
jgi:hypothetical protein